MASDQVGNPALVEKRRKEWTNYFQDSVRDLDIMRGFNGIFGKAF